MDIEAISATDMSEFHFLCEDEADTASAAAAIAPLLRQGDAILLTGGLATGKTYFVKALVKALGSEDLVTSPTFALAQFYGTAAGAFLHVDAYRLSGMAEYRDLGLEEYVETSIVAVEWGEKVEEAFPERLSISLDFAGPDAGARRFTISSSNPRWTAPLARLAREMRGRLSVATENRISPQRCHFSPRGK
uniref:tRNA threonylcarbamoyladenosine biosynthesis protein TsaE n=1 Tax=Candidatus Kentrum sp. SD TaxID=2126332 RepID=A0A450YFD5_9GAMM|nr:MAG: tRNA threonylcarbamoyladenosine biosynthesis protein TsaE [Candidatus Kentron sp. SD]VFK45736.1 MAG: tRNA threonylcarbamoyladenosine biosynthesis protein TsaE [Candidatus Kentron sp. SD]VFK78458.1 MAG: tRNA threonylcarbamoyladenosine biosynthesis protein TsaE [Candidatus Kentron sp. SD]